MRKRADALKEYANYLESELDKCKREHGGFGAGDHDGNGGQRSYRNFRPKDAEGMILPDEFQDDNGDGGVGLEGEEGLSDEDEAFTQEICVPTRNLKVCLFFSYMILDNDVHSFYVPSLKKAICSSTVTLHPSASHRKHHPPRSSHLRQLCPASPVSVLKRRNMFSSPTTMHGNILRIIPTLTGRDTCLHPSLWIVENTTSTGLRSLLFVPVTKLTLIGSLISFSSSPPRGASVSSRISSFKICTAPSPRLFPLHPPHPLLRHPLPRRRTTPPCCIMP